jgi:hypothetical protein
MGRRFTGLSYSFQSGRPERVTGRENSKIKLIMSLVGLTPTISGLAKRPEHAGFKSLPCANWGSLAEQPLPGKAAVRGTVTTTPSIHLGG